MLELMNEEELKHEYAKWDFEVRRCATWSPQMDQAERRRQACEVEINRRRQAA